MQCNWYLSESFFFFFFFFFNCSYLVTIMGLVIPWSFTLAIVDGYSVLVKCPIRQPGILFVIVVGDWVWWCYAHRSDFYFLTMGMNTYLMTTKKSYKFVTFSSWQVLSILTLAAACSTASVVDLLLHTDGSYCPQKFCNRYQLSAAMAFLTWFLSSASSLFNLWLLPSLWSSFVWSIDNP